MLSSPHGCLANALFFLQPPFCTTGWLEGSGLVPPKKNSVALKYFALEKGTPAGMIGMDWGRDAGMHGGLCFWECNPNPNIQDLESLPGFLFFTQCVPPFGLSPVVY